MLIMITRVPYASVSVEDNEPLDIYEIYNTTPIS